VYKIDSIKDLSVKIKFSQRSENDQHFLFHEIKNKELIICINKLHPYFNEIDDNTRVDEIIKQYLFDALAEYQVSKAYGGRIESKAIRHQKDKFLRAKIDVLTRKDLQHTESEIKNFYKEAKKQKLIKNKLQKKKKRRGD